MQKKLVAGHLWSDRIYLRLSRQEIAFFRFVLEAYDNLAYMSVVDKYEAILRLNFSPDQREEVLQFLQSLGKELNLEILRL